MIWLLVFFQGKVSFIQNVNSLKTEDDFHKNQGQMPIDMAVHKVKGTDTLKNIRDEILI